jgi:hypothetical protein
MAPERESGTTPSEDELARTATAPGSGAAPAEPEPVGSVLGRYRLERELGAGGMGVVHAAFDPDLERRVALKVLRARDGGEESRQRLLREARAMARLTHPNVVTVHEVGSAGGRDYVAMELVDGETLADWLRATPRPHDEIMTAFLAAGRGLAAAHAAGLVHRDFKPHNVLRRRDGRIVVTDFGLARGVDVDPALETTRPLRAAAPQASAPTPLSGLTQTGSVLGTPAYMAPEQWSGGTVGPAADQFAYCVALWEALAGERPFRGASLDELKDQLRRGPDVLDDSKLPRRLRRPLRRGLAYDPRRRWASMDALLAALGRAERRPVRALVAAGGALAALGIGAAVLAIDAEVPVAAPGCQPSLVDPAGVWSPALANELRDRTSPDAARLLDTTVAAWHVARAEACEAEPALRARRLTCFDAVLVRLDAVRRAAVRAGSSLDDVARQLIDPAVCAVEEPPRLPTKLAPAVVDGLVLRMASVDEKLGEADEAAALAAAGDDPCARATIRLARADRDDEGRARDAAEEAVTLAEACGDDRLRAEALLEAVGYEINAFLDPKLEKRLHATEAAVRKVAQPDLNASLDLLKATIAGTVGQWDEQLRLAEAAIAGYGASRPRARVSAALMKVRALQSRRGPGDLEASRAELARWRAETARTGIERLLVGLDALDASAQWELGDVAGANARLEEIVTRAERLARARKPPSGGDTIRGVVVDGAGKPVAGAKVHAALVLAADGVGIGLLGASNDVRRGITDDAGRYELEHVPAGSIVVAQLGERRSRARPARSGDRLELAPTARVAGRVVERVGAQPVVFAIPADRDAQPMYQLVAPIMADGSFELGGVPLGKLRVGVVSRFGAGGQSFATQEITVTAAGLANLELRAAPERSLGVIVRSSSAVPLSGAHVFVAAGTVSIATSKEIERVLFAPGVAVESARAVIGEPPPELGTLVPGDLAARFSNAPLGLATACALGYSGDLADPALRDKLAKHHDKLDVRCVPVPPDAKVVTVEVPPMKRLD